jgi:hypothetical protein
MATPRVVISSRSSPVLPFHQWREISEHAGADGIDFDIVHALRRRLLLRGTSRHPTAVTAIQSIWIGEKLPGWLTSHLSEGCVVVVPFARLNGGRKSQTVDPTAISALRQEIPGVADIAIALTPVNHEGTRTHLDRISAFRHIAEEWDVDIALDLTGAIDPRWEAEAAILRLGERLRLTRFVPPSFDHRHLWHDSLHMREVSVARVLAAIADFGLDPTLSLNVPMPLWDWANPIAIADRIAIARSATLAKFQSKTGPLPTPPKRVG